MDVECIEDGDIIVLKSIENVTDSSANNCDQTIEFLKHQQQNLQQFIAQNNQLNNSIGNEQPNNLFQESLDQNEVLADQYYGMPIKGLPRRKRGRKGQQLMNPTTNNEQQESTNTVPLDFSQLVETPNFESFNFICEQREELIQNMKIVAANSGFKAIIPYTDRNNRVSTSVTFCCSLASVCQRKRATNCPFKVTYIKYVGEQYYRLLPQYFKYHNHQLPVADILKESKEEQKEQQEQDEQAAITKEQEQIIQKLKRKGGKYSQESESDDSRGKQKKSKDKKSKKKKKKKSKRNDRSVSSTKSDESKRSSQEILIFDG